jgi:phytanoyl-CoA hydroxylase
VTTSEFALTSASTTDFDRDGFVVLPSFFSADEVDKLRGEVDRYIRDVVPSLPAGDVMYEDKRRPETLKQLPHIAEHDLYFRELLGHGRTVALAEQLLGQPVVGKELEWFNKVPQHSRETPAHQDGYYFMLEPQEALTMWIALDDVDENNGCLRYIRGSHRRGLRPHVRSEILGFSQGIPNIGPDDERDEAAIAAHPGDLLVHHSLTIHRADANRSERRQRRSLGMIYYSTRARQDTVRLQSYQRKLHDEWKEQQKI